MVRVLHTADVHLSTGDDHTVSALESVLAAADSLNVDALTVGGDLFDTARDAESLRDSLRSMFSEREYPVLAIPGNHDSEVYRSNLFFGSDFVPATDTPFHQFELPDRGARVTCLPFTPDPTEELLVELQNRDPFDGVEFLLLHCSLEAPFSEAVGDESTRRYFPVTEHQLAELEFEYYLAGHYHSNHLASLPNGGTFVYPGSPASVTRGETGRRTVAVVDTADDQPVRLTPLDTFHYDELSLTVRPGGEAAVLDAVRARVEEWDSRPVEAEIVVDGFIAEDEREFAAALSSAAGEYAARNRTRTVDAVLSHPLFEEFDDRLAARDEIRAARHREDDDVEAFQDDVRDRTLAVFADLAAEGELS